jgi:non-specific serine/threonine protein kinase
VTKRGLELSGRQAEVAALVVAGKSNREIAGMLFVTERTVETHVTAIYTKLDVHSRTELALRMRRTAGGSEDERAAGPRANLPPARKRLVGREPDCALIKSALEANAIVTITGAGGVGKTRIALAVGNEWQSRTRDGVWFADLASLSDPGAVPAAIALALGVAQSRDAPSLESLTSHLHLWRCMILLDNCEHVVDEAARVVDAILNACPNVKILVTSREPLRVAGEVRYRLPSLPSTDAVQLFTERVADRVSDVRFADADRRLIADICERLDGIPLAIELAAARVGVLSVAEIAANLEHRFSILSGGERTALPRHRTMRALLDWSYDLLSGSEQRLFAQLAIFAGGCTREAAAAVCSIDHEDERGMLDALASLIEKSLVMVDLDIHGSRYRLLESSRIYAREKLIERGEENAAARDHARFYTRFAEAHEEAYATQAEPEWRKRSTSEIENWRAALRWSFGDHGDAGLGQRLAGALGPVWRQFAYAEGRAWVNAARAHPHPPPDQIAARLAYAQAGIALGFADYDTALRAAREALALYRRMEDPLGIARAEYIAGHSQVLLGDAQTPVATIVHVLQVARRYGDVRLVGLTLESLAIARLVAADSAGARTYFHEALGVFRKLRADRSATLVAFNLAEVEFQAGQGEAALEIAVTALPAARALDPHFVAAALGNIAAYLIALDRYDEAERYALDAYEHARGLQLDVSVVWALQRMAAIAALSRRRYAAAARLLGYVDGRIADLAAVRHYTEQQEYDRIVAALREALDEPVWMNLRDVGASMDEELAVSEALRATA